MIDTDKDGAISLAELGAVSKKLTEVELKDKINDVDADANGTMDLKEFSNYVALETRVAEFAKSFDKDGDSLLSNPELALYLAFADKSVVEKLRSADVDADANLSPKELRKMLVTEQKNEQKKWL